MSSSPGWGWGWRFCIFSKLPDDAGQGTRLRYILTYTRVPSELLTWGQFIPRGGHCGCCEVWSRLPAPTHSTPGAHPGHDSHKCPKISLSVPWGQDYPQVRPTVLEPKQLTFQRVRHDTRTRIALSAFKMKKSKVGLPWWPSS